MAKVTKKSSTRENVESHEGRSYDPSLDVVVAQIGEVHINDYSHFNVALRSYNGGQVKVDITKRGTKDGKDWATPKLGRLTPDHAAALLPLIEKAIAKARKLSGAKSRKAA